jgi:hypothetical protein
MYMYIRTKNIPTKQSFSTYAYLVKSKRRHSKVKQKNLKYLGRVYKLSSLELSLQDYINEDITLFIHNTPKRQVILKLIEFELLNHGFKRSNSNQFIFDEIKADLNKLKIKNKLDNSLVLEINEGFLCEYTINSMLNFKFPNLNEKECGKSLANVLLNTGIKLNQELFINLFRKFYEEILPSTNQE